ncbi:MAG: cytochrome c biogenesis protein CcsA [Pyrinomonadaceae bacterium]
MTLRTIESIGDETSVGIRRSSDAWSLSSWFWVSAPITMSLVLLIFRLASGVAWPIGNEALMVFALGAYLVGAVFLLTNLYAPAEFAARIGKLGTSIGVFLNLSSWLFRWVEAYERELAVFASQGRPISEMPWVFRYVPFANLYDLSLAFAFGAGFITLLVLQKKELRSVAAFSLPLAAMILVLARFIGGDFIDLPPVLDSYWRPIHVGIASLSYGVALVCFAAAVLFLIKDGLRVEVIRFWVGVFVLGVLAAAGRFGLFASGSFGVYGASAFQSGSRIATPIRVDLPWVGTLFLLTAICVVVAMAFGFLRMRRDDARYDLPGLASIAGATLFQLLAILMIAYQIQTIKDVRPLISDRQMPQFAIWMLQQKGLPEQQIQAMPQNQLSSLGRDWVDENAGRLSLGFRANPVEHSAFLLAFCLLLFVSLFSFSPKRLRDALPEASVLDDLVYKLAGAAFAGLALLLITGAVWANESWGRYWGWDSKEVGALVAWLAYAAFLHSRISRGWNGRRSAYFAIIAFLFVVFTYLGVSYLLPGLHSYA